jgi:hypothetical protein
MTVFWVRSELEKLLDERDQMSSEIAKAPESVDRDVYIEQSGK